MDRPVPTMGAVTLPPTAGDRRDEVPGDGRLCFLLGMSTVAGGF